MKILFVIRNVSYGGAGKQLAMLANELAEYGHEVEAYFMLVSCSALVNYLRLK